MICYAELADGTLMTHAIQGSWCWWAKASGRWAPCSELEKGWFLIRHTLALESLKSSCSRSSAAALRFPQFSVRSNPNQNQFQCHAFVWCPREALTSTRRKESGSRFQNRGRFTAISGWTIYLQSRSITWLRPLQNNWRQTLFQTEEKYV